MHQTTKPGIRKSLQSLSYWLLRPYWRLRTRLAACDSFMGVPVNVLDARMLATLAHLHGLFAAAIWYRAPGDDGAGRDAAVRRAEVMTDHIATMQRLVMENAEAREAWHRWWAAGGAVAQLNDD